MSDDLVSQVIVHMRTWTGLRDDLIHCRSVHPNVLASLKLCHWPRDLLPLALWSFFFYGPPGHLRTFQGQILTTCEGSGGRAKRSCASLARRHIEDTASAPTGTSLRLRLSGIVLKLTSSELLEKRDASFRQLRDTRQARTLSVSQTAELHTSVCH